MNNIDHIAPLQPSDKRDTESDKTPEEIDFEYDEMSEFEHTHSNKNEYSQSVGFIKIEHSYGYIPYSTYPDKRIVFSHRKTKQLIMVDLKKKNNSRA